MAVPFLVSLRVLCEHFENLSALGEFLAAPSPSEAAGSNEAESQADGDRGP